MDVSSRVRTQLAEGIWPDEIVKGLVADGLSEANARRIVDRIASEPVPEMARPIASGSPSYQKSYEARRFPIEGIVVLVLIFGVGGYGLYQWKRPPTAEEVAAARKVADQDAADRERIRKQAEEAEKQIKQLVETMTGQLPPGQVPNIQLPPGFELPPGVQLPPGVTIAPGGAGTPSSSPAPSAPSTSSSSSAPAITVPSDALGQRVAAQLWMTSPDPILRCEGARHFKDTKTVDTSGTLLRLLEFDPQLDVRRCALDALVAAGQAELVIGPVEAIEKNGCCRDFAIYGFKALENHEDEAIARRAMWGLRRLKVRR